MKTALKLLFLAVVQVGIVGYEYGRGWNDGINYYRHSQAFYTTLFSMYKDGFLTACMNPDECPKPTK